MPRKVAVNTLNASTADILNTIRANASLEYQNLVPVVNTETDIPKVGQVIYGYPALANQFLSALVNRIALVRVKSATFNNAYARFKKGYLEFGETVEDVFVNIANVRTLSAEKAEARELKRSLPDVRSAFYAMNWTAQYPVTVQDVDLQQAFTSWTGVQDLIAKIVESVYLAEEYDEFLLFKYLLIKAISHGQMKPVSIGSTPQEGAVAFRGTSNMLTFMSNKYNEAGVLTATPRDRQCIFMDAQYNATQDVEVLATAFNMDKAEFMGKVELIDDWTSFDNERFAVIRSESDMLEEVTADELALLANVKAVIVDEDWFQVYDNSIRFTEKYVASGLYWNYFLNTKKTFAHSPFANAVVFVTADTEATAPESVTVEITGKDVTEEATVLTLSAEVDGAMLVGGSYNFVQTEALTSAGIAVHKYGALIIPASETATECTLVVNVNGKEYTAATNVSATKTVGDTVTCNPA